ncbi:MAG: cobaltochelatase subunit CobN [Paracoccaceae bacterium]|nr:cobaltochelatase subunit CobN [Paracoccaceae bacterium]
MSRLAANWVRLRDTPAEECRVGLVLANYPNRYGRIANGVGLDTPASAMKIIQFSRRTATKSRTNRKTRPR